MNNPQLPIDPRLLQLLAVLTAGGSEIPLPILLSLLGATDGPMIRTPQAARLSGLHERTLRHQAGRWLAEQEAGQRPQVRVAKTSPRGRAHWEFDQLDIVQIGVAKGVPAALQLAIALGLMPGSAAGAAPSDAATPQDGGTDSPLDDELDDADYDDLLDEAA